MSKESFEAAIHAAVEAEVAEYRKHLLATATTNGAVETKAAQEAVEAARVQAKYGRKANGAKSNGAIKIGSMVRYNQGRGTFEAKVTSIDPANGEVYMERVGDGKKVSRPPNKISAA